MIQQMLAIWSLVHLPFLNPAWTSGSSRFLLKPGLENFGHYFTSVWDECNCVVVWAFFGIAFLWDWNENWPFPVLWPLLSFPNAYYSAIKRKACDSLLMMWMKLEPIIESEVCQKEKNKNCICISIWNLEGGHWWNYLQGSNGDNDIKKRLMDMGWGGRRGWGVCRE